MFAPTGAGMLPLVTVDPQSLGSGAEETEDCTETDLSRDAGDNGCVTPPVGDGSSWVDSRTLSSGDPIGRYLIVEQIGEGGMGVVYSAYDPELDRKVAIKLLRTVLGTDTAKARLLREAQAMARLAHPHIVAVHEVDIYHDDVFIVMEFVEGVTLKQWIKSPRSWQEVVEVMVQAGRGLAAAHAKGLIHRDFKPENVMVGDDGRVRVMDFGLVRASGSGEWTPVGNTDPSADSWAPSEGGEDERRNPGSDTGPALKAGVGSPLSDGAFTGEGRALGTPAYMSPEQHAGCEVDARTDVFSYCVTLYELLYRQRPFRGRNPLALAAAMATGKVQPPPRNSKVPGWLDKAVLRGMATASRDRWGTLDALLSVLSYDRGRRVKRWLVGGGLASAVVLGGVFGYGISDGKTQCQLATTQIEAVWNDTRRADISRQFEASGLSYAASTWKVAAEQIETWTAAWSDERLAACEATHVAHEQSEALLDQRMSCLDHQLDALRSLLEHLAGADADIVAAAVKTVAQLPTVEMCGDDEYLAMQATLHPPPPLAKEVETLRARLRESRHQAGFNKTEEGLADARAVLARAQELGWPPLIARAWLAVGHAEGIAMKFPDALTSLQEGYRLALREGLDLYALEATIELVWIGAVSGSSLEAVRVWRDYAEANLPRHEDPRLMHRLALALALLSKREGDFEGMLAHAETAVQTRRSGFPHGSVLVVNALNFKSAAQGMLGRHTQSIATARAADAMAQKVASARSNLAGRTASTLGSALWRVEDFGAATAEFQRALKVLSEVLEPDSPQLAVAMTNVAMGAAVAGDFAEAIAQLQKALAIKEKSYGPKGMPLVSTLTNLGGAYCDSGDLVRCMEMHERARSILAATVPLDHPRLAQATVVVARTRATQGDREGAIAVLDTMSAEGWATLSKDLQWSIARKSTESRLALLAADAELAERRAREAIGLVDEEAAGAPGVEGMLAEAHYVLARALKASPKPDLARVRAEAATAVNLWTRAKAKQVMVDEARALAGMERPEDARPDGAPPDGDPTPTR